jgi:site-specific recombinase XerD
MKEKETRGKTEQSVRSLPVHLWPGAYGAAWQEACRPSVRLKRGGAASHMRPVTQEILTKCAGYFFDFLSRSGRLDINAPAGSQVTPENVEVYVAELKSRVKSVTVYGRIQKLRRFVQLVSADRDLEWLIEIERQLFSEMRPASKRHRVVYTDVLEEAGLKLMAEAESSKRPKLTRARLFRNGLMITLLARCPIRLKNFAALEIGRSFVDVEGTWWIVLTAAETKEKREDERPVPEEFTNSVERYLKVYRPILAKADDVGSALWLAINGEPMSYASMGELITETTRTTLGINVNPHLFRTSGVSTLATRAGNKPHAGSALLHHRRGPVTQENYNRASCLTAGKSLAAANRRYRRGAEKPLCKIELGPRAASSSEKEA